MTDLSPGMDATRLADTKAVYDELVATRGLKTKVEKAIAAKVANLLSFPDSTSADVKTVADLMAMLPRPESSHVDLSLLDDSEVEALHALVSKATVAGQVDEDEVEAQRLAELKALRDEVVESRQRVSYLREVESERDQYRGEATRMALELGHLREEIKRLASAPPVDNPAVVEVIPPRRLRRAGSSIGELVVRSPQESPDCMPAYQADTSWYGAIGDNMDIAGVGPDLDAHHAEANPLTVGGRRETGSASGSSRDYGDRHANRTGLNTIL